MLLAAWAVLQHEARHRLQEYSGMWLYAAVTWAESLSNTPDL